MDPLKLAEALEKFGYAKQTPEDITDFLAELKKIVTPQQPMWQLPGLPGAGGGVTSDAEQRLLQGQFRGIMGGGSGVMSPYESSIIKKYGLSR